MYQGRGSGSNDMESVRLEYRASLADLTFNSKPIITNLTIIAQENTFAAAGIVQAIEDQIRNAQPKQKLPVFYLLDSICKNIGSVYVLNFTPNLLKTFMTAYDAVDTEDRARLIKVLSTWWTNPGGPLFPPAILQQIEEFIKRYQSRPVPDYGQFGDRRGSGPYYYVNPNFMQAGSSLQPDTSRVALERLSPQPPNLANFRFPPTSMSGLNSSVLLPSSTSILSTLHPQPTLLPFQRPTTSAGIQNEIQTVLASKQHIAVVSPSVAVTNEIILLGQLLTLVQTTILDANTIDQIARKLREISPTSFASPIITPPPSVLYSAPVSTLASFTPTTTQSLLSRPVPSFNNIDLSSINLVSLGFLQNTAAKTSTPPPTEVPTPVNNIKKLPRVKLTNEDINRPLEEGISFLYDTLELQCKQCGIRYAKTTVGKRKLDEHLDWHFRQNRRAKDKGKHTVSRDWYLTETKWIEELEVEFAVKDRKSQSSFFFGDVVSNDKEPEVEKKVSLPVDDIGSYDTSAGCEICNESFEKFYDDDTEMWMLGDAVLVDQKIYHHTCFKEYQTQQKQKIVSDATKREDSPLGKRKREEENIRMDQDPILVNQTQNESSGLLRDIKRQQLMV